MRYRYKVIINAIWAIPLVLLIRIIRPALHVRICGVDAARIGQMIPDLALHLQKDMFRSARTLHLYFFLGPISNLQWALMAQRSTLKIFGEWLRIVHTWNRLIPGGRPHELPSSFTNSRDIDGIFEKFDCSIPFTTLETSQCKKWLKSKGWKEAEPFVVLHVRDSEYLKQWVPTINWNYHSYRDSKIETYLPAAEWLNSQGVWVIRTGQKMLSPIQPSSKMIIDYAFDEEKSDLLDIWLFANCNGCITTVSGPDMASALYLKPLLCVNASPLGILFTMFNSIHVPKNLFWKASGTSLNLKEYLDHTFFYTDAYRNAGICIVDLTPEEILSATKEFWGRIQGTWDETESELKRQHEFWEIFLTWPSYHEFHNWKNPLSRIGVSWLESKESSFMTSEWLD